MPQADDQAPAKARSFFEKAATVAETGNFDYAIDMYLQGLRHAPDALMEGHLPLCELALHRQGKNGKKPSMVEKVKHMGGKTPLDQMLNAEYLFTKAPEHMAYAEAMLKAAVAGDYVKTAGWIANLIFQTVNATPKPSAQTYILLKEAYTSIGQFDEAIVALQRASKLKPSDKELADEFKNLTAELTMVRGKYNGESGFRESIKDRESQEKLHGQSGVVKTEEYRASAVEDARKRVVANPDLSANIFELANALSDLEDEQAENDAIALLENTYKARSDFSFAKQAGVLKIKQIKRKVREAKTAVEANSDDAQAKALLEQLSTQLHDMELEHYRLCVKNYPTDLSVKFEYALRLVADKHYDQAIPLLQQAQKDPRRKIAAMSKVGFCFAEKGWLDDAIDVYTKAINSYEIKEDAVAKELRYNLGNAYEQQDDTDKALEVYRRIAQVDFTYKDVSSRVDKLRRSRNKPDS
ncbi:MAG: tetratricopeptide repeat protein [Planctomycetes bacterium]|nr:tetratricopeptide repeat protein [Planctomycetota bacterium]